MRGKQKAESVRLMESSANFLGLKLGNVVPDFETYSDPGFEEGNEKGRNLGVMVEGQFKSYFARQALALAKDAKPAEATPKPGSREQARRGAQG